MRHAVILRPCQDTDFTCLVSPISYASYASSMCAARDCLAIRSQLQQGIPSQIAVLHRGQNMLSSVGGIPTPPACHKQLVIATLNSTFCILALHLSLFLLQRLSRYINILSSQSFPSDPHASAAATCCSPPAFDVQNPCCSCGQRPLIVASQCPKCKKA